MICCKKSALAEYLGMNGIMDEVIHILCNIDKNQTNLNFGRTDFSSGIYCNRTRYRTTVLQDTAFETHMRYADVHTVLFGSEMVYFADAEMLETVEKRPEEDYILSNGVWHSCVRLTADNVLIVFPGEAHKPGIMLNNPTTVEKVVFKFPAT